MSHFLYIHKDLTGEPNVWKVGVAITPYSAVRARQKFCWNQFGLQHLYFGIAHHVEYVEDRIKQYFRELSGKSLQNFGTQTEMFKIDIKQLLSFIDKLIVDENLNVRKIEMQGDYTASNSGACPFRIPSESYAKFWAMEKCIELFGPDVVKTRRSKNIFNEIFSYE